MRAPPLLEAQRLEAELEDRVLAADACLGTVGAVRCPVRVEVETAAVDALDLGVKVVALFDTDVGREDAGAEGLDEVVSDELELTPVQRGSGLRFRHRIGRQVLERFGLLVGVSSG